MADPTLWQKTHTVTWYPDPDDPSPPPYDQMVTVEIMRVEDGTCYSLQDWVDDNISILFYDPDLSWQWWDGGYIEGEDQGPLTRTGTPSPSGLNGRVEIQAVLPDPEPDPEPPPPPPPPPDPEPDPEGWTTTHVFTWSPVDTETYGAAQTVDLMLIITSGAGIAYTRDAFVDSLRDDGVHWTRDDGWTFSGLPTPYGADATWTMQDIAPPPEMFE
jgi:hypothetical protein